MVSLTTPDDCPPTILESALRYDHTPGRRARGGGFGALTGQVQIANATAISRHR